MSRSLAPTLGQVMRRPRWIGALLLALLIGGGFAGLAQWQMGYAVHQSSENEIDSETVVPLSELNSPNTPVNDGAAGRRATVTGTFVPGDFLIVENRVNEGDTGVWVVGHLRTDADPAAHLSVAIGWAPDTATAKHALAELDASDLSSHMIDGRYMPAEGPVVPEPTQDPWTLRSMQPGQLANLWTDVDGDVYAGFFVSHTPEAGLIAIDSVPPLPQEKINWLNLFYALEWVVFAGFALFFWYRITRDAWEKELDELEEAAKLAAADESNPAVKPDIPSQS